VVDTIPAIVWSTLARRLNTYVNKRFVAYSGRRRIKRPWQGWER